MQKVEILDQYIGEILELLDTTGALLRDLKEETGEYQQELKDICYDIVQLWALREKLYEKNPQMPQFELHQESSIDQQRVKELLDDEDAILQQYRQQHFQAAYEMALQWAEKAQYGFFKQKAEAMLFLCQMQLNHSLDKSLNKSDVDIEELETLYQTALEAEHQQDFLSAVKCYEQLSQISRFSQYELKGQAGMYRCSQNRFQAA